MEIIFWFIIWSKFASCSTQATSSSLLEFFFSSLIIGLEYDQLYTSSNSRRTIGVEFSRKRINEAVDDNDFTNILVVGRIIGPKMPDFGSQKFDKKFFSYSWVYLF